LASNFSFKKGTELTQSSLWKCI